MMIVKAKEVFSRENEETTKKKIKKNPDVIFLRLVRHVSVSEVHL